MCFSFKNHLKIRKWEFEASERQLWNVVRFLFLPVGDSRFPHSSGSNMILVYLSSIFISQLLHRTFKKLPLFLFFIFYSSWNIWSRRNHSKPQIKVVSVVLLQKAFGILNAFGIAGKMEACVYFLFCHFAMCPLHLFVGCLQDHQIWPFCLVTGDFGDLPKPHREPVSCDARSLSLKTSSHHVANTFSMHTRHQNKQPLWKRKE